jgi:hypothetical protein
MKVTIYQDGGSRRRARLHSVAVTGVTSGKGRGVLYFQHDEHGAY